MRKVYILRHNEEDGRVLDALAAQGIDPEEGHTANPKCPVCGADTLLAFAEGDDFEVLTWFCITEENEGAGADAWYLVCSHLDCDFEEAVERVDDPMDADLFDMMTSHYSFDEYCGITSRPPDAMKRLIAYLEALQERQPNRKLDCLLEEARWRYDEGMQEVREQLQEASGASTVRFDLEGRSITATYIAATEGGVMVLTNPEGQMLVLSPELVRQVSSTQEDEEDKAAIAAFLASPDAWVHDAGYREMVTIQGYHLQLCHVDRVGQYHVRCWEEAAALALGLRQVAKNYWEGRFRRSDVEARYDVTEMVKVRGHWLEVSGRRDSDSAPQVNTEDSAIAAELGLSPIRSWEETDRPKHERTIVSWQGVIPLDQVEEHKDLRSYFWPIPELPPDSDGNA